VYLEFLTHCRPRFAEAMRAVATAPGTVVFHCHGGKDRTGLLAAMLLRLAGVSVEAIAEDYALSSDRLRSRHDQWLAEAADEAERARIERITSTMPEAMVAVLETVDRRWGGVERYLLDGGLTPAELASARGRLR
jgi:protein tyrosine/serine phosphatase